jgi:Fe-S cluster assembly protein SufD
MEDTTTTKNAHALATGGFTREAVAELSRQRREPAWLAEKRQRGWSLFEDIPLPTTRDEHWRRTDLRPLKWETLRRSVDPPTAVAVPDNLPAPLRAALDLAEPAAGRLVLWNGHPVWREVVPDLVARGVIFTDLATAVHEHPDLVRLHLMSDCVTAGENKFTALHAALWDGGAFIYVPPGVEIKQPFEVVVGLSGEGTAVLPHTLIVADHQSVVTVIEDNLSLDDGQPAFSSGVSEIIAGAGAQVTYAHLQRWGDGVLSFNTRRALHATDSRVVWELGQLGGRLSKTYVDSLLRGDGASTQFNGVYFVRGRQHIDLDTLMHHSGRGTTGDLLLKGAAQERGRAVFEGMIRIDPGAQQTDSYLKSDNLILSDKARIDAIPGLVIDANDVRASHGATVGRVDEDHIFYLQSRGIPRAAAVRMVVEGFFTSVFDRMSQERVRRKLAMAVSERLGD